MSQLRRLLACFVVVAAVSSVAAAMAATTQSVPADEARAKKMVLRKADFEPGFEARRPGSGGGSADRAAGLDCGGLRLADLGPTGAARVDFTRGPQIVQSYAYVYAAPAEARAAHRGFSGRAGRRCLSSAFRAGLGPSGRIVSFKSMPFPKLAERAAAFRAVMSARVQAVSIRVYADWVMLQHSRAQAILLAAGLVPLQRDELVRFARLVEGRMKTTMRGA